MEIDDIESQHVGEKHSASIDKEDDPCRPLINNIRRMFESLVPPLTSECCIYRVPVNIRVLNRAAYTPRVLSIGPFHRGIEQVQTMEKHKKRYLNVFLQRAKVSLEKLVRAIKEWEERVRRCYAETIDLDSDEFVKMILLDGGFIIEYFMRDVDDELIDKNDEVLYKPWLSNNIQLDMMLLENQLPFFFLEKLFNLAFSIDSNEHTTTFLELACSYFLNYNEQNISSQDLEIKHFTDMVRRFYLPSAPRLLPSNRDTPNKFSCSAMELYEAGVKFKVGSSKCLFDMQFTNEEFQILHFSFYDEAETLLRNLMALEQCHYPDDTYICDYICLMDTLINTAKDVELLVRNEIILNWFGDHDVLANLFTNLCREIIHDHDDTYFRKLCDDLTMYHKDPWHSWKATLKRDYFSTPWRIVSTVAAVILLLLTLMQTVNSFISL